MGYVVLKKIHTYIPSCFSIEEKILKSILFSCSTIVIFCTHAVFPTLFRISAWIFVVSFAIVREFWRWTFAMSASKRTDLSQNVYFEIELIMEKTIEVFSFLNCWTYCDWEKLLKFKTEGLEIDNCMRSLRKIYSLTERDHPFKTSANFHDFWPLPPFAFLQNFMKEIFDPYILWPFDRWHMGHPSPLRHADVLNGWSQRSELYYKFWLEKLEKSCPFHLKLHAYLLVFSPISMFLFIMTPRHLDTAKFKISISVWTFGYNAFALSIPFVSSTIRILFTNIPRITTGIVGKLG